MEVDQEDTLGNVSESSLHQATCSTSSCKPIPRGEWDIIAPSTLDNNEVTIKIDLLIKFLEYDMTAVDVKWSLFVASATCYRFNSCLKPFPPQFLDGVDKNINKLRDIISQMPSMSQLLIKLKEYSQCTINPEIIDLLHWVVEEQEPKLLLTNKKEFENVLNLAPSNMKVNNPNFIFRVTNKWSDTSTQRWQQLATRYGTLYAYHGSKLENFHSILRYGLQQHLNKNGLFGAGIYLSSELGVSLPYSLTGCAWPHSGLGSHLSCIVLCETINHPDVKCQISGVSRAEARARALSCDSIGGEVPEKYYLVCNSDLVRVRYLLVYSKNSRFKNGHLMPSRRSAFASWLYQHKMILLFCAYIALLLAIGVGNSPGTQQVIKRAWRQLRL